MQPWTARRTLLIVGEGRTEEAFLQHLKALYVPRGCGLAVSIKNARGKGAQHVIQWTGRQIANRAYDSVAVLLDTDQDWTPAVAKLAKARRILVLKSEPCFEALMLRLLGQTPLGDARLLKKQFSPYVNGDGTRREHYAQHFGAVCLADGRVREATIDALLKLFGV